MKAAFSRWAKGGRESLQASVQHHTAQGVPGFDCHSPSADTGVLSLLEHLPQIEPAHRQLTQTLTEFLKPKENASTPPASV